VSTNFI